MAEITRRRSGELQRGVFSLLIRHPEGLKAKDVLQQLEKVVPPTAYEAADYPKHPGVRRFEKIIRFGSIAPVKAGWLTKTKGTWSLTDAGRAAYEKFKDPEEFVEEAGRLYRTWFESQSESAEDYKPSTAVVDSEEARETTSVEEAEEEAWNVIEEHLSNLGPYDFQELIASLIRAMGYHVSWVAPPGPDRGIDIIAHADPLGIEGSHIKVQVKHRSGRIPVGEIRSFLAVLSDKDVGIFVSSGGFTKDAEEEARYQERRRIVLMDSERLFDLWVEHYDKIPEQSKHLLPLRPVYFLDIKS